MKIVQKYRALGWTNGGSEVECPDEYNVVTLVFEKHVPVWASSVKKIWSEFIVNLD